MKTRISVSSMFAWFAGAIALAAMATPPTLGQTELAKLTATDAAAGDNFGNAVAIDGSHAIIGARLEALPTAAGAAYIFRLDGASWVQHAKLVAEDNGVLDRASGDNFGVSVGISGDVAVVGSWQDVHLGIGSGSAYVFRRNDNGTPLSPADDLWVQEAKLLASDRAVTDRFGLAVAIENDVIAIGADRASAPGFADAGAVYVFRYNGSAWSQEAKLNAGDPGNFDSFAESLAIDGDTIIAGARQNDDAGTSSGSAYVFRYDGSSWSQEAKLLASDAASGDLLGVSVSVSADVAIIGAEGDDDGGSAAGAAYVFRRTGAVWTQEQKLLASDALTFNSFGNSVAISGNTVTIGSYGDGSGTGSIYVFQYSGSAWSEVSKTSGSDSNGGDQFSRGALAMQSSTVIVGAAGNEPTFNTLDNHGAAYVFQVTGAANVDTDGDGLLDSTELQLQIANSSSCPDPLDPDSDDDGLSDGFENDFGPNMCNADVDGDGLLDGTEVDIAQGTGCPNATLTDSDGDGLSDGAEVALATNPCSTDTDGDGVPDNTDPDPTVPGVPQSFLGSLTLATAAQVQGLDVSSFSAPNANAQSGRRNAMANNLNEAAVAIGEGDYEAALASLLMVVNKVDGVSSPPDWMPDSPEKTQLYEDVQTLIALVQMMI